MKWPNSALSGDVYLARLLFLIFLFKFIAVFKIQFRDHSDSEKQTKWLQNMARFVGKTWNHFFFRRCYPVVVTWWENCINIKFSVMIIKHFHLRANKFSAFLLWRALTRWRLFLVAGFVVIVLNIFIKAVVIVIVITRQNSFPSSLRFFFLFLATVVLSFFFFVDVLLLVALLSFGLVTDVFITTPKRETRE